jgi:hypothetical protein
VSNVTRTLPSSWRLPIKIKDGPDRRKQMRSVYEIGSLWLHFCRRRIDVGRIGRRAWRTLQLEWRDVVILRPARYPVYAPTLLVGSCGLGLS